MLKNQSKVYVNSNHLSHNEEAKLRKPLSQIWKDIFFLNSENFSMLRSFILLFYFSYAKHFCHGKGNMMEYWDHVEIGSVEPGDFKFHIAQVDPTSDIS